MANNVRSKIKNELNYAENDVDRAIARLHKIMGYYLPENMDYDEAKTNIFHCINFSTENELNNPMEVYRQLQRDNLIESLGEYEQHLFNIGAVLLVAQALRGGVSEFKLWERMG